MRYAERFCRWCSKYKPVSGFVVIRNAEGKTTGYKCPACQVKEMLENERKPKDAA